MDGLIESAREVLAINNRIVDREVHRLQLKAEQVQRGLIVLVFLSTAVALTIALALTRYIARPISEIDGAIRQLGGRRFLQADRGARAETCATSGGGSTGCDGDSTNSRRRRTASCAMCRTS